jgi:hypothetical protein
MVTGSWTVLDDAAGINRKKITEKIKKRLDMQYC